MKRAFHTTQNSLTNERSFSSSADVDKAAGGVQKESTEDANVIWLVELATWFLIILTLLLGLAAGYLLWAKLTSAWPFPQ